MSALVIISLTLTNVAAEDISSLVKQVMSGVVLIKTYDSNGTNLSQGSGFVISEDGDVVTCYHVMRGYSTATVTTADEKTFQVKDVIALNRSDDLTRVSLSASNYNFTNLTLNTTTPDVGAEIIAIGGPLGLEKTVSKGIVSAIRDNAIQITAPVSPGSSGGPVFNINGEVIGITSSQIESGQNLNFAIHASRVAVIQTASEEQVKELCEPYYPTEVGSPDADIPLWATWGYHSEEVFLESTGTKRLGLSGAYNEECNRLYSEKYNQAIQCYDCILREYPSHAKSWNNKGAALYRLNRFEEALVCFNNSIEIEPSFWEYWYNKGATLWRLHREEEAEIAFSIQREYHIYTGWITRLEDPRPSNKGELGKLVASTGYGRF